MAGRAQTCTQTCYLTSNLERFYLPKKTKDFVYLFCLLKLVKLRQAKLLFQC